MQAFTSSFSQNLTLTLIESWLVRLVTAAGVAIFGDKVFTNNVAINVAGVATSGLVFAVNEVLHYLKTNKKVATVVAGEKTAVANDPALASALAQLSTSLKTLESNLASGGKPTNV